MRSTLHLARALRIACRRAFTLGVRERGITLIEVTVAVALLGTVVAVLGPVMTGSFNSARVTQNESRALDEVRIAVGRIDRELRSAKCIGAPLTGQSGDALTFTTLSGTGGEYDVTYSVDAEGALIRTQDGNTTVVGNGIVVTSKEFSHVANPGQRASVRLDIQVRFEDNHSPRRITTEIAGRNAWGTCP